MNMNRIFRYAAAAAILLTACSKFDDMNKNPYALYDAPAESFVQPILYNTEYTLVSRSYDLLSELMQYSVNYNTEVTSQMNYNYSITESVDASIWLGLYPQAGNAEYMLHQAEKEDNPAMKGVALILKTLVMSNIVDAYGNVPYFDALKIALQKDPLNYTTRYEGNVEKWRRFGNSLYLRLLMRAAMKVEEDGGVMDMSGTEHTDFSIVNKIAELYDCFNSGSGDYPLMRGRKDAAVVGFSKNNSALYTPFYAVTSGNWNSVIACETLVNEMYNAKKGLADPRYYYYFTKPLGAPTQLFKSNLDAFLAKNVSAAGNSKVGRYPNGNSGQIGNLKNADRYALMNYSELLFIFAEAGQRGWLNISYPVVKKIYLEAVTESALEWNTTESAGSEDMTKFIGILSDEIEADNALEKILTQKWVSMFWVGIESWCDYRRTGYPVLKTNGEAADNNYILPTRLRYPADEKYRNPVTYQESLDNWLGGTNNMRTDVWWASTAESRNTRLRGRK